jgi:hypothetical protein
VSAPNGPKNELDLIWLQDECCSTLLRGEYAGHLAFYEFSIYELDKFALLQRNRIDVQSISSKFPSYDLDFRLNILIDCYLLCCAGVVGAEGNWVCAVSRVQVVRILGDSFEVYCYMEWSYSRMTLYPVAQLSTPVYSRT